MGTIRGRLARGGMPATGHVELRRLEPQDRSEAGPEAWEHLHLALGEIWLAPGPALRSAKTGEDGRFSFTDLMPDSYEIRAIGANRIEALLHDHVADDAPSGDVVLELPPGDDTVRIRVKCRSGEPFDGEVRLLVYPDAMFPFPSSRLPAVTDGNGLFAAARPGVGHVQVEVRSKGRYVVVDPRNRLPHEGEIEVIVDDDLDRLAGRIVDGQDGRPVGGAWVFASSECDGNGSHTVFARPGEDGRFVVGVPGGDATLTVRAKGFVSVETPIAAERGEVHIRLDRTCRIRGVVRTADGTTVVGVDVAASGEEGVHGPVVTDAAGAYEISDVTPGQAYLVARGAGWSSTSLERGSHRAADPVFVAAGETADHDLVVIPAGRVAGHVLDAEGAGVAGVRIVASPLRRRYDLQERILGFPVSRRKDRVSGTGGLFRLDALVPGLAYELRTDGGEVAGTTAGPIQARSGETVAMDLHLPSRRTLDVLVLEEATGCPVPGARVVLGEMLETIGWHRLRHPLPTGDDGRVCLGPLPDVDLAVSVVHEELASTGWIPLADVVSREDDDTVVLRLRPGLAISGRILGPDGEPLSGGVINVWPVGEMLPFGERSHRLTLDAEGRFRLTGLEDGRWQITLQSGPETGDGHWVLGSGDEDVTLRVRGTGCVSPGTRLLVRLVDTTGRPVTFFEADIHYEVARVMSGSGDWVRSPGAITHEFVDRRALVLVTVTHARDADGVPLAAVVSGPYDAVDREIELTLRPERRISGEVRGPGGVAVVDAMVEACAPEPSEPSCYGAGESHGASVTNGEGRFDIGGLGEGPYRLRVEPPDGLAQRTYPRVEGGEAGIEIEMVEAVGVTLRLIDDAGRPVAQGSALVQRRLSRNERIYVGVGGSADRDGIVRLSGLDPEGRYDLSTSGFAADGSDVFPGGLEGWRPREDETIRHRRFR